MRQTTLLFRKEVTRSPTVLTAGLVAVCVIVAANIASVLLDPRRRALYDRIAGTTVLRRFGPEVTLQVHRSRPSAHSGCARCGNGRGHDASVSTTALSEPTRANRAIGPVGIVSGEVDITDRIPAVASVALTSFLDGRRWPSAPALTRRRQLRRLRCAPRNVV